MTVTAMMYNVSAAYANVGNNMSCFKNPAGLAKEMVSRWIIFYVVLAYAMHAVLKGRMKNFVHQAQAKQSHDSIQSVFDTTPDGIIILTGSEKPKVSPDVKNTPIQQATTARDSTARDYEEES